MATLTANPTAHPAPFDALDAAIDSESWDWPSENLPGIAEGVVIALKANQSPDSIRRRVIRLTQRPELALRVEQAARHVDRVGAT